MSSNTRNKKGESPSSEYLPQIVIKALDRRKYIYDPKRDDKTGKILTIVGDEVKEKPPPADQEIIDALKDHIRAGLFRPDVSHGGYIDIMQKLGHNVQSMDPFAKDKHLNVVNYIYKGANKLSEDELAKIVIDEKNHQGVLRYFRYQEFIDLLKSKGLMTDDYFTTTYEPGVYVGPIPTDEETEGSINDDISNRQLKALGRAFSQYVGYVSSIKNPSFASLESISKQCRATRDQYACFERPLGKALIKSDVAKTGKSKNKSPEERHEEEMQTCLTNLLTFLETNISSTRGFAKVMFEIFEMLSDGSLHDVVLSRCILCYQNGKLLQSIMKLYHVAAQNAKNADCNNAGLIGYYWWLTYHSLIRFICYVLNRLAFTGAEVDLENAMKAFKKTFLPDLLSMLQPKDGETIWFSEERAIWIALDIALTSFPSNFSVKFIRKYWSFIEENCQRNYSNELKKRKFCSETAKIREEFMAPRTISEVVNLVSNFCAYGMEREVPKEISSAVTPGPLVIKVLKRGIVPLLMQCSRSSNVHVVSKATFGLGQISKSKDCRNILLDHGGQQFIQELVNSKDASCLSNVLLLLNHLSWDAEWRNSIVNMKPHVEQLSLKLATFSMKLLLQDISTLREGIEQRKYLELKEAQTKKESIQFMQKHHWQQYEVERAPSSQDPKITAISRCMMLLGSNIMLENKVARDRLKMTDFLRLVEATIDVPIENTFGGSVSLLHNFMVYETPDPNNFADAEHFVDTSLCILQKRSIDYIKKGTGAKYTSRLVFVIKSLYKSQKWRRVIYDLTSNDKEKKFLLESIHASPDNMDMTSRLKNTFYVHNDTLSGRLSKCDGCGKIESKEGEWKRCSRCKISTYCSRDCQKADWEMHKKVCVK